MVRYYTAEEVARHNCHEDCWVSIFHNVFDITELIAQNQGELTTPLIKAAGTSISHWFNKDTGDIKTYIDPEKNIRLPYTPGGRFVDVPPSDPRVLSFAKDKPWWLDSKFMVGKVITTSLTLDFIVLRRLELVNDEDPLGASGEHFDAHDGCHQDVHGGEHRQYI